MSENKDELLALRIEYLIKEVDKTNKQVSEKLVTKDEFTPVRNIVYGMVSTILLAVLGALVALIIK